MKTIREIRFVRAETTQEACPFATEDDYPVGRAVPVIYRDVTLTEMPVKATLEVAALGIYEPFVNGRRIGDRWFAPGWTDYNKRLYTQQYDITAFLNAENRIGIALADGWFAGNLSGCRKTTYGGRQPEAAVLITLQFADGRAEQIESDTSWRFAETEVRYADFYMGTLIDHRYPSLNTLMTPGRDVGLPVVYGDGTEAALVPDMDLPVCEERRLTPVAIKDRIYDFGQNFVGVLSVTVKAQPGGRVTVRHGEMLDSDGSLYTANLRGAKSVDIFICAGEGEESFLPAFTFHGFRYAEIVAENAEIVAVEGVVLTTKLPPCGEFVCDHPLVRQLYANIVWGMRGNFLELPTDCPQRDERLGWTGDAQVFCRTAMFRQDCSDFYRKYLANMRDSINVAGAPCDIAPALLTAGYATAAWADAIVVIPYQHYLFYGDTSIITENLAAMEGWLAFQLNTSHDYCRPDGGYGDWLSVRVDETPKGLLGTAYFARTAWMLSYLCEQIGETEKSAYYHDLYEKVSDAFRRHYVAEDGTIRSDSQCVYLLALAFDLVQGELAGRVAGKLKSAILRDDSHLTCGFVGISLLLPVLSEWGMNELAYTILLNETYPSWGYTIRNGATTIWERWNSFDRETGFGDETMNSFNHYSLGSCGEWLTGYMCGIRPDPADPAFHTVIIAPELDPLGRVQQASAYYDSRFGRISSVWKRQEKGVLFTLTVPEGVQAMFTYGKISKTLSPGTTEIVVPDR